MPKASSNAMEEGSGTPINRVSNVSSLKSPRIVWLRPVCELPSKVHVDDAVTFEMLLSFSVTFNEAEKKSFISNGPNGIEVDVDGKNSGLASRSTSKKRLLNPGRVIVHPWDSIAGTVVKSSNGIARNESWSLSTEESTSFAAAIWNCRSFSPKTGVEILAAPPPKTISKNPSVSNRRACAEDSDTNGT